jgi:hypothetical protein
LAISNDNHSTWNEQVLCKFKKKCVFVVCCHMQCASRSWTKHFATTTQKNVGKENVIRVTYGWPPRNDEYLDCILNTFM